MKVDFSQNNRTSFGAKFIGTARVFKLSEGNKYLPLRVNFAELEPENRGDVRAIENVSKYWQNSLFTTSVYNSLYEKSRKNVLFDRYKYYVLTTQKSGLELLDDEKILGINEVVEFARGSAIHLNHIEANPEYIYKGNAEYKNIGSAMLDSLKELYSIISVIARDTFSVKNFYLKNEFYPVPENTTHFVWYKHVFSRFPY